jgi:hypothetical protein
MAADTSEIPHGPAAFKLDDTRLSHTTGGITATISQQSRFRNVDEYGVGELEVIHTGDQVRMGVPLSQWDSGVLSAIYDPGADETDGGSSGDAPYKGIGRTSGYVHTTVDAKIVPLLASQADKHVQFWRASQIGDFELSFSTDNDRIFDTEWACLVDENEDDGALIGKIKLPVPVE